MDFWTKIPLSKREKQVLLAGGAFVAGFIILHFIIFPLIDAKAGVARAIRTQEKALQEIIALREEYRGLEIDSGAIRKAVASRPKDFTLFSFLEQEAGQAGLKSNIQYMKPSAVNDAGPYKQSMVEMKLEGITLTQLVDYLALVESPEYLLGVKRLSVRQSKGSEGYLSVLLQMVTYQ
ncbi:MAG: type II secretion system protein GspM [Deltaproteobacteria bacterium]|nr:type II secretion system protein GspM [Deltaproteobacteria bacterium]